MLFKFTAVTAIKGLNAPMNQLLNILISHQCYFTNTPAVTERSDRGDTGFSSKAGRRCVSPPGQFPPTFLQFITPQLCWYNSLLLTVIFRLFISGIQVMAQLHKRSRRHKRGISDTGVRRVRAERAAGEQRLLRLGLLLNRDAVNDPGLTACSLMASR